MKTYTAQEVRGMLENLAEEVLFTAKCNTIDEQIRTCEMNCELEYDECCKKWKAHWTKYDEGLRQAQDQILELIKTIE